MFAANSEFRNKPVTSSSTGTGLHDASRTPCKTRSTDPASGEKLILDLKNERPTWGAAKVREYLMQRNPDIQFPVRSTIHAILNRKGLVGKHRKRRFKVYPTTLTEAKEPNAILCTDYKGQFRLGNRKYRHPLTISDRYFRYMLCCDGLDSTNDQDAHYVFQTVFGDYGLPDAIRSDNGCPFSSRSVFGLSKLSVWWLRLGIRLERIEPGHPEENGRHERMHRTLKESIANQPGANSLQQQEKFYDFRDMYNNERPHEALHMKT